MNKTEATPTAQSQTSISSAPRLDTAGIAALLGCTRQHVTSRLTKRVDFPKPFINVSRRIRYWKTVDIKEWMSKPK